ncbi:hypothetical protein D3C73_1544990 [compost metagenome]
MKVLKNRTVKKPVNEKNILLLPLPEKLLSLLKQFFQFRNDPVLVLFMLEQGCNNRRNRDFIDAEVPPMINKLLQQ